MFQTYMSSPLPDKLHPICC